MKLFIFIILNILSGIAFANNDISEYFNGKSGCFLLYNLNENKIVTIYNPTRCSEKMSPDSTFKIALSLMAFDKGLITQKTVFKWDGVDRKFSAWNEDQTPNTWLKYSVVWVSRKLTPQLGMDTIKDYLNQFHYGNQNFSGDFGQHNGLTNAWLSSSLKISPDQQLVFLKNLVTNKLPVSKQGMLNTKENMYLETMPNGWQLYGKTGTGDSQHSVINNQHLLQDGWFIGFIQKSNKTYIFVTNFSDIDKPATSESGGTRAKNITKVILKNMNL